MPKLVSLWKNMSIHRSEIATLLHDVEEMAATFASFDVVYARRTANFHYKKNICSNRTIFFVGAAGDGAAPTVGVLRTHETSRPYKWHTRGGW